MGIVTVNIDTPFAGVRRTVRAERLRYLALPYLKVGVAGSMLPDLCMQLTRDQDTYRYCLRAGADEPHAPRSTEANTTSIYTNQIARIAALERDSTFVCNTRQLYDAYSNTDTSVYRAGAGLD